MGFKIGSSKQTTNYTDNSTFDPYGNAFAARDIGGNVRMRDVGLTGANAVALAGILDTGATNRAAIAESGITTRAGRSLDTVDYLIQQTGNTNNQLIGGAGALVVNAAELSTALIGEGRRASESFVETAKQVSARILPNEAQDNRAVLYGVLAVAAVAIYMGLK